MAVPVDGSRQQTAATLTEAVERGIITGAQARAIADLCPDSEAPSTDVPSTGAPSNAGGVGRLRPLLAEALGYLGGALAFLAGAILIERLWGDLASWGRVGLIGVTGAGLMGAGAGVRGDDGPLDRLRGFLWMLATVAVAGTAAVAMVEYTGLGERSVTLLAALVAAAVGLGLWRVREAGLQQATVFVAVLVSVTTAIDLVDASWTEAAGAAVWAVGVAWASAAWAGLLGPRRAGVLLGAVAALAGPMTAPDDRFLWVLVLGLATAGLLIALSVVAADTVLLGLGILGVFVFVPRVVFAYFGDALGAALSLLITGAVLVVAALSVARRAP